MRAVAVRDDVAVADDRDIAAVATGADAAVGGGGGILPPAVAPVVAPVARRFLLPQAKHV